MGRVLIWGKCAYFGKSRISHFRYSLYGRLYRIDSSIRIGLFVYNFRKKSLNKHIFVRAKRVWGYYYGKSAYYEWAQYIVSLTD